MHFLDYDPDESEFAEELYYGDDWQWDDEEWYDETQFGTFEDEEVPEELDQASQDVEDANVNYLHSRQKMRELALARGFYPVVALARHGQQQGWWQKQWQGF
jgi:hypothetical protein